MNVNFNLQEAFEQMRAEQRQISLIAAKDVFNVDEVAIYTGFSKGYIYKLVCTGMIPYYKSNGGKCTFFKREEINSWLCKIKGVSTETAESEAALYAAMRPIKGRKEGAK